MNTKQAAEYFGMSESTLLRLTKDRFDEWHANGWVQKIEYGTGRFKFDFVEQSPHMEEMRKNVGRIKAVDRADIIGTKLVLTGLDLSTGVFDLRDSARRSLAIVQDLEPIGDVEKLKAELKKINELLDNVESQARVFIKDAAQSVKLDVEAARTVGYSPS